MSFSKSQYGAGRSHAPGSWLRAPVEAQGQVAELLQIAAATRRLAGQDSMFYVGRKAASPEPQGSTWSSSLLLRPHSWKHNDIHNLRAVSVLVLWHKDELSLFFFTRFLGISQPNGVRSPSIWALQVSRLSPRCPFRELGGRILQQAAAGERDSVLQCILAPAQEPYLMAHI